MASKMDFTTYPRPAGDTGIGFHWFPDTRHYDKGTLKTLGGELKSLGASWLVLFSDLNGPVPDHFLQGLKDRGIEPVMRLHTPFVTAVDAALLGRIARYYAAAGVRYLTLYRSPNTRAEWTKWPGTEAPYRFMEVALPALEALAAVDEAIPIFPSLAPGGDFDDLAFLDECMEILAARGSPTLRSKLAIGVQNFPWNKPLSWGRGGSAAWPASGSGDCPAGSEDHLGFCLYEWYQEIVRERLGRTALMIATENGPRVGDRSHAAFPAVDESRHAEIAVEMAQTMMHGRAPSYLANSAFWLLGADDGDPDAAHRWYRSDGTPILARTIEALKALPKQARPSLAVPSTITVLMEDGKVESMDMQQYLMGVLPGEMPASSPLEALKAQAIAARTYAARAVEHPRHGKTAVCTTTHCQVWSARHNSRTDQAVRETAGTVLSYNKDFIGAYYFGHCDGHTRNSEDVWQAALPYCRSVACVCGNTEMHGHGVGMCQEGAIRMAQQGALAHEILAHYYTGARVHREDGTFVE